MLGRWKDKSYTTAGNPLWATQWDAVSGGLAVSRSSVLCDKKELELFTAAGETSAGARVLHSMVARKVESGQL